MLAEDDLIVIKPDKTYRFSDYFDDYGELRLIQFEPPSINQHVEMQQVGNQSVVINRYIGPRTIPLSFDFLANDKFDFELMRHLVQEIFIGDFYIISGRFPTIRWPVRVDGSFNISRFENSEIGSDVISPTLICDSGLGESIATTVTPFTYDAESWSIGMNLPNGEDLPYSFKNQCKFKVYNASRIPLVAEDGHVLIKFVGNAPGGVTITNRTTGQAFVYSKGLAKSDTLLIKGIVPTVNGQLAFANSNHQFIDLARSWNEFSVEGTTDFEVSFETRFYY